MDSYKFKIANQDWEFEQIHRLNYETFVEEIPQHEENTSQILVDKFHDENTYIICVSEDELVGMIAVRDKRPFSLDQKLENLDLYLPTSKSVCEIRLLSIKKRKRNRNVIRGLFKSLAEYCEKNLYDLALISATTHQKRLYNSLGFKPFGPRVGNNGVVFQPMYLTLDSYHGFKEKSKILNRLKQEKAIFLPGPVAIKKEVSSEFNKEPVSHRSEVFVRDFVKAKELLCQLTSSKKVQFFTGSGTLANDIVASRLSLLGGRGLILSNGEFGERLRDHAFRVNLNFDILEQDWGNSFSIQNIEQKIKQSDLTWLWFVHCETSTGVLNSLDGIKNLCNKHSVKLCVDCISSIGTLPLDLSNVYLATGASGKGLASYPGLSFVFYNDSFESLPGSLPRYFDLGYYDMTEGVPFTVSSNLLYALKKSLEIIDIETKYRDSREVIGWIREKLDEYGLTVMGKSETCSPAIITFELPNGLSSEKIGSELEKEGFYLSYRSEYLLKRNLMQIALMGEFSRDNVEILIDLIGKTVKYRTQGQ